MEKKTILRIAIAILWIGVGVFEIVRGSTVPGIISLVVGAVFAFDAFRTMNKNKKSRSRGTIKWKN